MSTRAPTWKLMITLTSVIYNSRGDLQLCLPIEMQQSFDILAVTEIKTLKKFKNSVATPEKRDKVYLSHYTYLYYFITLTESHNTNLLLSNIVSQ